MTIVTRDLIGLEVARAGGKVTSEIRMVGRVLYKVSLPPTKRALDLTSAASAIRRKTGAAAVNVADNVYHAHLEIIF